MFKKYNDTPAAIAISLVTIFFIIQVVLFAFTAETFLEDTGIGLAALPMVYWLSFSFCHTRYRFDPYLCEGAGRSKHLF
jgi:hypothetical protein|tara:strand:+ start:1110 stop:1346 length:237 start_codon:yes stop_codon:yes gene_type:complete